MQRRPQRSVSAIISFAALSALALTASAPGATKEPTGKWHLVYTHADYAKDSFTREVMLTFNNKPKELYYHDSVDKISYLDSTCVNEGSSDLCALIKRIDVSQIDYHLIKVAIVSDSCVDASCEISIRLRVTVNPYIQKTEDGGLTSNDTSGEWLPKKQIVVVVPGDATSATVVAKRGNVSASFRLPNNCKDSQDTRIKIVSCYEAPPLDDKDEKCAMQTNHRSPAKSAGEPLPTEPCQPPATPSSLIYELSIQDMH